ncbi:hypothetical protein NEDG_00802 [Nematocida displodere]|uniref:Uncharacterized protein n=1 Tax=Nematocida displodere TaxID=1805483 RepID=A0A177EFA0_9MICR|nr:hypothetical protein NEDG_00802 [Nematocida displodere]
MNSPDVIREIRRGSDNTVPAAVWRAHETIMRAHDKRAICRFQLYDFLEYMYQSIYRQDRLYLGVHAFELVVLGLVFGLAMTKIISLFIYSRVYAELLAGLRGEYGTSFKATEKQRKQDEIQTRAAKNVLIHQGRQASLENPALEHMDNGVDAIDSLMNFIIQEQSFEEHKIPIDKAIKKIFNNSQSILAQTVIATLCAIIFTFRALGIFFNLKQVYGTNRLDLEVYVGLHATIQITTLLILILLQVDKTGSSIAVLFNLVLNAITLAIGTLLNWVVSGSFDISLSLISNPIFKNVVFIFLGLGLHTMLGVPANLLGNGSTELQGIYAQACYNLIGFLCFNIVYIIIYELDLYLIIFMLTNGNKLMHKIKSIFLSEPDIYSGFKKTLKKSKSLINTKSLIVLRFIIYSLIIAGCWAILKYL